MNIVSHNLFKRINAKAAPKQHTIIPSNRKNQRYFSVSSTPRTGFGENAC